MSDFLWNRVLGFISKRERCEKEVREYLIKKYRISNIEYRKDEEDELIAKLKSLDFLNEERYTKAYIHDNYNLKHKGKNRIRQELTNRRIDESMIEKYLGEIGKESELEKALELARKRHELIKNLPVLTQKRRLYGLLVRRGFGPSIALDVVDSLVKKE